MKLLNRFLDLIFPPRCVFCRSFLPIGTKIRLCSDCRKKYTQPSKGIFLTDGGFCMYSLNYTGAVRRAILGLKFRHRIQNARPLAEFLKYSMDTYADKRIDFVTWVPTTFLHRHFRGYDQSELLTRYAYSEREKIVGLLKRRGLRPTQPKARDRIKNVKNTVRFKDNYDISGKNILLIDDIVTSGATLMECRRVLFEAGASRVYCAALAHHERFKTENSRP